MQECTADEANLDDDLAEKCFAIKVKHDTSNDHDDEDLKKALALPPPHVSLRGRDVYHVELASVVVCGRRGQNSMGKNWRTVGTPLLSWSTLSRLSRRPRTGRPRRSCFLAEDTGV